MPVEQTAAGVGEAVGGQSNHCRMCLTVVIAGLVLVLMLGDVFGGSHGIVQYMPREAAPRFVNETKAVAPPSQRILLDSHSNNSTPMEDEPTPAPSESNPTPTGKSPAVVTTAAPPKETTAPPAVPGPSKPALWSLGNMSDRLSPVTLSDAELAESKAMFRPVAVRFPSTGPRLEITSEATVAKRDVKMGSLMGECWGSLGEDGKRKIDAPRYDVVMLPLGCHGDSPVPEDKCTSCRFVPSLMRALGCGSHAFASVLGDNFYPFGIDKKNPKRLDRDMTAKYWRHPRMQMKYYATVGNHDLHPKNQIRTNHKHWVMPTFHHFTPVQRDATRQEESTTVQMFFVDTHWGFRRNTPDLMAKEAEWLDEALNNSTARWKIVASHEPIWGFMDFEHSRGLVEAIHPVLVRHKVALYVSAHTHSVHLHRCQGGYHQLVAAGYADNLHLNVKGRHPPGFYHLGRGGVATFFNQTHAVISAFDDSDRVIFHYAIPHPADAEGGKVGKDGAPYGGSEKVPKAFDADPMWSLG